MLQMDGCLFEYPTSTWVHAHGRCVSRQALGKMAVPNRCTNTEDPAGLPVGFVEGDVSLMPGANTYACWILQSTELELVASLKYVYDLIPKHTWSSKFYASSTPYPTIHTCQL